MYDRDHVVTLNATIVAFDWTNPHLQIAFEGTDDKGKVQQWVAEGPGPSRLSSPRVEQGVAETRRPRRDLRKRQ
jgi:hypothetical protein